MARAARAARSSSVPAGRQSCGRLPGGCLARGLGPGADGGVGGVIKSICCSKGNSRRTGGRAIPTLDRLGCPQAWLMPSTPRTGGLEALCAVAAHGFVNPLATPARA